MEIRSAEGLVHNRIVFTRARANSANIFLASLFVVIGFFIPDVIDWPLSFVSLILSAICCAFMLRLLLLEVRVRRFFAERALANDERLDTRQWAKLQHTWTLLILCVTMILGQVCMEFALRKDLRSRIPLIKKFLNSANEDLKSYIARPYAGNSEETLVRIEGQFPRSLILRKGSVVPLENGALVWPAQLHAQNKLAMLDFEKRTWIEIKSSGAVPEFRFDPEVMVIGTQVFVWGGSADDDSVSSIKRRAYNGGSVFDLRTKIWTPLPAIPVANLLRSSRLMQMGNSVVLVSLNYDKSSNGFVNSFVLSKDYQSWKPFKSIALKDFNAVEVYCEKGLVFVVGELGQELDGVLKSVNKVASSVKDVLEIGTFQERMQVSQDGGFRFRVFDFAESKSGRAADEKIDAKMVELPQGLNGAIVVNYSPGLLFLRGADEELILCRFRPFECPRLVNSVGANVNAGSRNSVGGRIEGDSVYFWQNDRSEFQEYNFATRSLHTIPFGQKEKKSVPLFVFSRGNYLFGQTGGLDPLAESEFKDEIRSAACELVPFSSHIKICVSLRGKTDLGKRIM